MYRMYPGTHVCITFVKLSKYRYYMLQYFLRRRYLVVLIVDTRRYMYTKYKLLLIFIIVHVIVIVIVICNCNFHCQEFPPSKLK